MQFFALGCTMPIITLYLKSERGFSGSQIGLIMAVTALSSLFSPLIGACIADRLISAERLLSLSHMGGAVLLYFLSLQSQFIPVLFFHLFYWLIIGPTSALTTAITFHHAPHAVKTFGGIRLWGTLGWIGAAWVFRCCFLQEGAPAGTGDLRGALLLGVCSSLILSAFSLSIPPGAPKIHTRIVLLPKDSLRIIMSPSILTFALFAILISIADRMYMFGGGPYLKSLGFQDRNILPALSIGQGPEVFGLAILGLLIIRFGIKKVFLLGAMLEIIRFLLFAAEVNGLPLYFGISLHGLTFAFFFVTASIFLDRNCTARTRSGVHQNFALIVSGTSTLIGNLLAGFVADRARLQNGGIAFPLFWSVPLIFSVVGFVGILIFFKERSSTVKGNTENDASLAPSLPGTLDQPVG
ncbi:MAG: MFS transporter [Chitinispirillaceae bacterium]|nr:MFS transporter [Chitinispirillaceae bacterium]